MTWPSAYRHIRIHHSRQAWHLPIHQWRQIFDVHHSGVLGVPELSDFSQWLSENADSDPNHKAWYVGIYSVKKRLDTVLMEGDRVEIYRPLMAEPMARRKAKTKKAKKR